MGLPRPREGDELLVVCKLGVAGARERENLVLPQLQVMVQCSPQDKLTMVRHLKEIGEVNQLPPHGPTT